MRLDQVHMVISVAADSSLPLYAGPAMDKISKQGQGRLVRPNLPDSAAPELPRLAIQLKDAVLQLGNNRIELIARPPSHVAKSYESAMEFSFSLAKKLFTELLEDIQAKPQFLWSGVISTVYFPRAIGERAARAKRMSAVLDTANQILNVNLNKETLHLAGFTLNLGYMRSGYFVNYNISEYEIKTGMLSLPPGASVSIDIEKVPRNELGISLVIDVNSRPLQQAKRKSPMENLFETLRHNKKAFQRYPQDIGLTGALQ